MNTLQENISDSEAEAIRGGAVQIVIPILIGVAIGATNAAVNAIVDNWDDFKKGFSELTM